LEVSNDGQYILVYENQNKLLILFDKDRQLAQIEWNNNNQLRSLQWSSYFQKFLILSKNHLAKFNCKTYEIEIIPEIKQTDDPDTSISSMTTNDDHLILCHSFGLSLEHWSLSKMKLIRKTENLSKYGDIHEIRLSEPPSSIMAMNVYSRSDSTFVIDFFDIHSVRRTRRLMPPSSTCAIPCLQFLTVLPNSNQWIVQIKEFNEYYLLDSTTGELKELNLNMMGLEDGEFITHIRLFDNGKYWTFIRCLEKQDCFDVELKIVKNE
ncbi:unnamed protein product, partial [Didymodactylos carnosus]